MLKINSFFLKILLASIGAILGDFMFTYSYKPYFYFLIALSFLLLQFFLQLSFGILVPNLVSDFQLDLFQVGLLSASYYLTYVLFQLPAGSIICVFGTRYSISFGALFCGISAILFSLSHSFILALIARAIMGIGASFAFTGVTKVLLENFPKRQYSIMFGFSEAIAISSALFSHLLFANMLQKYSWHHIFFIIGFFAVLISALSWIFLPRALIEFSGALSRMLAPGLYLLKKLSLWVNGLFSGLMFAVVAAFSGLWATPFLMSVQKAPLVEVTFESSLLFLGLAMGSLLVGWLYKRYDCYQQIMAASAFITIVLSYILVYSTPIDLVYCSIIFFTLGFLCSGYIMCYTLVVDVVDSSMQSVAIGFTNTLGVLIAPLLQVLVGYSVETSKIMHTGQINLSDYQFGLKYIPLAAALAFLLSIYLPKRGVIV